MTGAVAPAKAAPPAPGAARGNGPGACDDAAAADGTAFLLALGACNAEADAAPVDVAVADATASGPDPAILAAQPAPPGPADPLATLPVPPPIDAAALLAQGVFAAPPAVPVPVPAASTAAVAVPAATDAVGVVAHAAHGSAAATARPAPQGTNDAASGAHKDALLPDASLEPTEPAAARGAMAAGRAHAAVASASSPPHAPSQAQAQQAAALQAEWRAPVAVAAAMPEPALQAAFASTGLAPRRSERADERTGSIFSATPGADRQPGVAGTGTALMPGIDGASAGAHIGHNAFAERMVEQVSWWLSQRTQSAELTLDVPGGPPVSVSVQVQGNEAQVAFRSDHPEARQLLASAMPQLKDMLGAEGLLLSGSSVGTSAGNGRQGDAPPGAPARTARIGVDALPAPGAAARPLPSGRTLDLYV